MNINDIITESQHKCPHCGGPVFEYSELGEGKKDACYYKVKASAKVWPSAYASGRLVQCRKKGAANYGNKNESSFNEEETGNVDDADSWQSQQADARRAAETNKMSQQDAAAGGLAENFADGRNPQDKGDAKRHGINTKASVSSLRKTAKQGGRKGQLAHWMANMKAGRAKNEDIADGADGADPGILFYAKLPNGHKVYARPKDAEQLADLQQKYRSAEIKTFDYNRPDVIKWLQARGVKLRSFWLGSVLIISGVMEAAHTANFNDDDWYEINPDTKTIVSQQGPQAYQVPFGQRQINLPNGNIVVRGMRAKGMGLDTGLDKSQQKEDGTWGAL
jgi:hypothetical protein